MCTLALPKSGTAMTPACPRPALAALASLMLGACASVSHHVSTTPPVTASPRPAAGAANEPVAQYVPDRDVDEVARMRSSAPPAAATIENGHSFDADDDRLGMAGFVRIGHGVYHGSESFVRKAIDQHAAEAGAERVIVYPPAAMLESAANEPGADAWGATYYVRYRLAFGATFRDLREDERTNLGGKGGVEIGSVMGGTPAARANLMAGDYVIAIDNRAIADKAAFAAELRANAGRSITLTTVRNGETSQRIVRLGEAPAAGGTRPEEPARR